MLDLAHISQQIFRMAVDGQLLVADLRKRLELALRQLHLESTRLATFTDKLALGKTSWLLAASTKRWNRPMLCPASTDRHCRGC